MHNVIGKHGRILHMFNQLIHESFKHCACICFTGVHSGRDEDDLAANRVDLVAEQRFVRRDCDAGHRQPANGSAEEATLVNYCVAKDFALEAFFDIMG